MRTIVVTGGRTYADAAKVAEVLSTVLARAGSMVVRHGDATGADRLAKEWCEANGYPGYTSYASLDDLPWRMPIFGDLEKALDKHVAAFCKELGFDLGDKKLKCNSLWINILPEGGMHASHIHPHSVISGTVYVAMPKGASALKLEDPRLPMMMARPSVDPDAPQAEQPFVYLTPRAGTVLMWESWLRHEVPMNAARADRISISFNYA